MSAPIKGWKGKKLLLGARKGPVRTQSNLDWPYTGSYFEHLRDAPLLPWMGNPALLPRVPPPLSQRRLTSGLPPRNDE